MAAESELPRAASAAADMRGVYGDRPQYRDLRDAVEGGQDARELQQLVGRSPGFAEELKGVGRRDEMTRARGSGAAALSTKTKERAAITPCAI